jgi:leucine-rich PPR motif-containing protein
MKLKKCRLNFELKDINCLSDILFKQLEDRFHGLFSALHEHNVSAADNGKCFLIEELTLLLRCCLVMLVLIEHDQPLLIQKGLGILSMLSRLVATELSGRNGKSSITFKKLTSRQSVSDDCTTSITEEFIASLCLWKPSDPRYAFLCAVLEVDLFVFASLFFSLVILVFFGVMRYILFSILQEYCLI